MTLNITARDIKLMQYLAEHKLASLRALGDKFFTNHPTTGRPNKSPVNAARRRITELAASGFLATERIKVPPRGTRVLVTLDKEGVRSAGLKSSPAINRSVRAHHVLALEAAERLCENFGDNAEVVLEHRLMREAVGNNKGFKKGARLPAMPDAEIRIGENRIAVEFVTSKYSNEMIETKNAKFLGSYRQIIWVADRASTALRVTKLTGAPCSTI